MKKTKLVIASVLKPVDDTRMYEKFGVSLSQTNKYDINIIGFHSKNLPSNDLICFHPLFSFNRLSVKRIFAPLKTLFYLIKLKPEVLIVNTHELLIVSFLYKILFGTKLLYDIRENYYRNIRFTNAFPKVIRPLLAGYVRGKEYLSYLFVNHYLLAEEGYKNEFSFTKKNFTVIENKFKPSGNIKTHRNGEEIKLLFTGTIAESTGILKVIDIAIQLHDLDSHVRLIIKGKCAFSNLIKRIYQLCEKHEFISCDDLSTLTDHTDIEKVIATSNFGFVYYPYNKSTINTKPTKLFEYLALRLPILLHNHKPWLQLANKYTAAIPINFENPDIKSIYKQMLSDKFYPKGVDDHILWVGEEQKLLSCIEEIC